MKRPSLKVLMRGQSLLPWLTRSILILVILAAIILLLRSELMRSADRTRLARVNAKNAEIRVQAVTEIQQQFRNNGSLLQEVHDLIPPLPQAPDLLDAVVTLATGAGWETPKIESSNIIEGSPMGKDISTVRFTISGNTSPEKVSLLLDRLQHTYFLLRVAQVSWVEKRVTLTGEFYIRTQQ